MEMSVATVNSSFRVHQYLYRSIVVSVLLLLLAAIVGWAAHWAAPAWLPWHSKLVTQGTISREIVISGQSFIIREPVPEEDSIHEISEIVFPISVYLEFQPLTNRSRFLVEAEKTTDLELIFASKPTGSDLENQLLSSLHHELSTLVPSAYTVTVLPDSNRWCGLYFYNDVKSFGLFRSSFVLLIVLCSPIQVFYWFKAINAGSRFRRGLCPRCSYPLSQNFCNECGGRWYRKRRLQI